MSDPVLKSAFEWEKESADSLWIWDPDGFRRNDGVTMDTPITFEEYKWRKIICTVGPKVKGMWGGKYND